MADPHESDCKFLESLVRAGDVERARAFVDFRTRDTNAITRARAPRLAAHLTRFLQMQAREVGADTIAERARRGREAELGALGGRGLVGNFAERRRLVAEEAEHERIEGAWGAELDQVARAATARSWKELCRKSVGLHDKIVKALETCRSCDLLLRAFRAMDLLVSTFGHAYSAAPVGESFANTQGRLELRAARTRMCSSEKFHAFHAASARVQPGGSVTAVAAEGGGINAATTFRIKLGRTTVGVFKRESQVDANRGAPSLNELGGQEAREVLASVWNDLCGGLCDYPLTIAFSSGGARGSMQAFRNGYRDWDSPPPTAQQVRGMTDEQAHRLMAFHTATIQLDTANGGNIFYKIDGNAKLWVIGIDSGLSCPEVITSGRMAVPVWLEDLSALEGAAWPQAIKDWDPAVSRRLEGLDIAAVKRDALAIMTGAGMRAPRIEESIDNLGFATETVRTQTKPKRAFDLVKASNRRGARFT